MREQSPEKFFSRLVNQLWYGVVGWKEIWTPHCTNLKQHIKLTVDGKEVNLPEDTQGLIFSNIPSFGGGMKLWDGDSQRCGRGGALSSFLSAASMATQDTSSPLLSDSECSRDSQMSIEVGLRNRKVKSSPNFFDVTASTLESAKGELCYCVICHTMLNQLHLLQKKAQKSGLHRQYKIKRLKLSPLRDHSISLS